MLPQRSASAQEEAEPEECISEISCFTVPVAESPFNNSSFLSSVSLPRVNAATRQHSPSGTAEDVIVVIAASSPQASPVVFATPASVENAGKPDKPESPSLPTGTAASSDDDDDTADPNNTSNKLAAAVVSNTIQGRDGVFEKSLLLLMVREHITSRWNSFVQVVKRRPLLIASVCIISLVLALLAVLISLTVIVPLIIQRTMNRTAITLLSALASDPISSSVHLKLLTLQQRPLGTTVTLEPFTLEVLFKPKALYWHATSSSSAQFSEHTGRFVEQLLRLNESHVALSSANEDRRLLAQMALKDRYDTRRSLAGNDDSWLIRWLQADSDESINYPLFPGDAEIELGQIRMPSTQLTGCFQEVPLDVRLHVTNDHVFAAFMRELLTEGVASWKLSGDVNVSLFGIRYGGLNFSKDLELKGPRLHMVDVEDSVLDNAYHEFLIDGQSPEVAGDDKTEDVKEEESLLPPSPLEDSSPTIVMEGFDLTTSQSSLAVLRMNVTLANGSAKENEPKVSVDPLGRLSLAAFVDGQELLVMQTLHDARLCPGDVPMQLVGVLPSMSEGSHSRGVAMTNLFRSLMQGKSTELEVRGLGSSVQLFSPGVEHLLLKTHLKLMGDNSTAALSLVQGLKVETMKLSFPEEFNGKVMRVLGQLNAAVVNPFGEAAGIRLTDGTLGGLLAIKQPGSFDLLPIAPIEGTIKSTAVSSALRLASDEVELQRFGHLSFTVDHIPLELTADIDLGDDPEPFRLLMTDIMTLPQTQVHFQNCAVDVVVDCVAGRIPLQGIELENPLDLTGLSGMKQIRVTEFNFSHFPLLEVCMSPMTADGSTMGVTVEFTSGANVEMFLGTLAIQLVYQDRPLIYMDARDCSVKPGVNLFNFEGVFKYSESDGSGWMALGATLLMGRPAAITVIFLDSVPAFYRYERPPSRPAGPEPPEWFKSVLVGMQVDIPVSTSLLLSSGLPSSITTAMSQAVERQRNRRHYRTTEGVSDSTESAADVMAAVQRAVVSTARIGVGFLDALSNALRQNVD